MLWEVTPGVTHIGAQRTIVPRTVVFIQGSLSCSGHYVSAWEFPWHTLFFTFTFPRVVPSTPPSLLARLIWPTSRGPVVFSSLQVSLWPLPNCDIWRAPILNVKRLDPLPAADPHLLLHWQWGPNLWPRFPLWQPRCGRGNSFSRQPQWQLWRGWGKGHSRQPWWEPRWQPRSGFYCQDFAENTLAAQKILLHLLHKTCRWLQTKTSSWPFSPNSFRQMLPSSPSREGWSLCGFYIRSCFSFFSYRWIHMEDGGDGSNTGHQDGSNQGTGEEGRSDERFPSTCFCTCPCLSSAPLNSCLGLMRRTPSSWPHSPPCKEVILEHTSRVPMGAPIVNFVNPIIGLLIIL